MLPRRATPAESYTLQWFRFDNATDTRTNVGEPSTVPLLEARAPAELTGAEYIGVVVTAQHPQQPMWATPATFYFRKKDAAWEWIGAER